MLKETNQKIFRFLWNSCVFFRHRAGGGGFFRVWLCERECVQCAFNPFLTLQKLYNAEGSNQEAEEPEFEWDPALSTQDFVPPERWGRHWRFWRRKSGTCTDWQREKTKLCPDPIGHQPVAEPRQPGLQGEIHLPPRPGPAQLGRGAGTNQQGICCGKTQVVSGQPTELPQRQHVVQWRGGQTLVRHVVPACWADRRLAWKLEPRPV